MKRLVFFLFIYLSWTMHISCLKTDAKKSSPEVKTKITSDEVFYEIKTSQAQAITQLPIQDSIEKKSLETLNNSTHQEMLVIYMHLEMSENQILLFEDHYNKSVNALNQSILTQNEIQDIINGSFEIVLSNEQFNMYNEWRNEKY